ncbi:PDR/VanB family oxidoreductase [Variovorax dokdonensis]|uniref:PDR/VanB family oxidoreductase n=1 Tax=Variovorax dokdonensis TaxID=344883 RepID=A0ABT7NEU6_9BURK|nr:PDR/VanB family oxidoreductase [Variovorax dokdonensis]MDM0046474.1 PDR/VanB family oxidoreductase [Variovorax dokdonensis]
MPTPKFQARVHAMRHEAAGIISIELQPAFQDEKFPDFSAGAHIDLYLPNGLTRSYSLCTPAEDSNGSYTVGVQLDRASRGGSRFLHEQLRVGQVIDISPPRNNFALIENAPRTVLISGGIGITPLWCMLQHLLKIGRPVELIYCARSRMEGAFAKPIAALADRVPTTWHFDDERGAPPDLVALLANRGAEGHYYCCGPGPMLDAFEKACEHLGYANAHIERFAASATRPVATASRGLEVTCKKSDKSVTVAPGQSILDALIGAGLNPDHSCKEGVCGACETIVVDFDGLLEHGDSILTKKEQESGKTMMICVSRCTGEKLTLDI